MRKSALLWLLLFFASFSFSLFPAEKKNWEEDWDFISLTFFPGIPPKEDVYNVYGLKLGLPLGFTSSDGLLSGAGFALFSSEEKRVKGWQSAIFYTKAEDLEGFQSALFWNKAESCKGLQFGLVNIARKGAVQVGLLNFIEDSPLAFFPFVNIFYK